MPSGWLKAHAKCADTVLCSPLCDDEIFPILLASEGDPVRNATSAERQRKKKLKRIRFSTFLGCESCRGKWHEEKVTMVSAKTKRRFYITFIIDVQKVKVCQRNKTYFIVDDYTSFLAMLSCARVCV